MGAPPGPTFLKGLLTRVFTGEEPFGSEPPGCPNQKERGHLFFPYISFPGG